MMAKPVADRFPRPSTIRPGASRIAASAAVVARRAGARLLGVVHRPERQGQRDEDDRREVKAQDRSRLEGQAQGGGPHRPAKDGQEGQKPRIRQHHAATTP